MLIQTERNFNPHIEHPVGSFTPMTLDFYYSLEPVLLSLVLHRLVDFAPMNSDKYCVSNGR